MRFYELTIITQDLPQLPIQPVEEQRGPNFITLKFYAEPTKIPELEKVLKANSLRYMVLVKKPHKEAKFRRRFPIEKPSFAPASAKASADKKEKKVDLKEIDKKIEEMLKE